MKLHEKLSREELLEVLRKELNDNGNDFEQALLNIANVDIINRSDNDKLTDFFTKMIEKSPSLNVYKILIEGDYLSVRLEHSSAHIATQAIVSIEEDEDKILINSLNSYITLWKIFPSLSVGVYTPK
jgi:CRISPR/Cas system CSM-associated protein Csm5 (group 7 of RAMP superfamily)